jgi:hypothetical protein
MRERYYNNLINAFMVNVGIRPASMLQVVDFKDEKDVESTLSKINDLFPDLYFIPNYQGIIISKSMITEPLDTCEKVGEVLGYPYKDVLQKMIDENISGYLIELICYYSHDDLIYKTQIIVNRCIELDKLNEFKMLEQKANEYKGYKIENIELIQFHVHYEKDYNTHEILDYVYHHKPYDITIIHHISNIIYNMGFENTEFIQSVFDYHNIVHRYLIMMMLMIDKHNIRLPECTIQPIRWLLHMLLSITNV